MLLDILGSPRLYMILETCKLHDVDPSAYAAVIAADRGEVLLPWCFTASS